MQRLLHFLDQYRSQVTLGLAVVVSLFLMALEPSEKMGLARGIATGLLEVGHRVFAWPIRLAGLQQENAVLREQNVRLSLELLRLREANLENVRLRNLLRFRDRMDVSDAYLAARVIARDPDRIQNTILIDVGMKEGVAERMPVITADGLVGRVLEAHPWTAVVQLLLDRNCRVSAIVQQEERVRGIVMYEEGLFYLRHVPLRSPLEVGDPVVSSGLGGVFPKGLLVGHIENLGEEEQGLFREVVLAPAVNFENLEEVFVLKMDPEENRALVAP